MANKISHDGYFGNNNNNNERESGPSYAKGIGLRNIKIILGNHSASQKQRKSTNYQ